MRQILRTDMFDSLRKALSGVSKAFVEKELDEGTIEDALSDLEMSLLQSDVALEVVDEISQDLKNRLSGTTVPKKKIQEFVRGALLESVSSLLGNAGTLDVLERIRMKNESGDPYVILFLGINGTGKTTTLAKMVYLLKQQNLTAVVAAADTFRAGAIEQLKEHTDRLQVKIISQNYNSDPAAVARDAVLYAKSHRVNCVLIDTAGRIQTNTNLMQQIEKIIKVVGPDLRIFVGDSLAGNDALSQAIQFRDYTNFDCVIMTKSDADAKGGAALSIVKMTSKPIVFLGVGQEYGDLAPFKKEVFLDTLFGEAEVDPSLLSRMPDMAAPPPVIEEPKDEPAIPSLSQELSQDTHAPPPLIEEPKDIPDAEYEEPPQRDPFEGISDDDIKSYSEINKAPPPESDDEALELATQIKKWISDGRPSGKPEPKDEPPQRDPFEGISDDDIKSYSEINKAPPPESDDEALELATQIKKWISDGRPSGKPEPKDEPPQRDPFEGISDDDIKSYSEINRAPPPESDDEALELATQIKKWISDGRPSGKPEPKDEPPQRDPFEGISDDDIKSYSEINRAPPPESDDEALELATQIKKWISDGRPSGKPEHKKKKRGLFGFFRK